PHQLLRIDLLHDHELSCGPRDSGTVDDRLCTDAAQSRAGGPASPPSVSQCDPVLAFRGLRVALDRGDSICRAAHKVAMATLTQSHRQVSQRSLWFGFSGAAAAWLAQGLFWQVITSRACKTIAGGWGPLSAGGVHW